MSKSYDYRNYEDSDYDNEKNFVPFKKNVKHMRSGNGNTKKFKPDYRNGGSHHFGKSGKNKTSRY